MLLSAHSQHVRGEDGHCARPQQFNYVGKQNFTFILPPGSSALLQTPECSEYHPSEQSPVVSALSLTRLQLSGTNSLFLSAMPPLSALLNLP